MPDGVAYTVEAMAEIWCGHLMLIEQERIQSVDITVGFIRTLCEQIHLL